MDWATFFKDYPAVIPAIATFVVAVLGFFFVRWNSTHNKNLDIAKKKFDKRMELRDMRVKEAREFVAEQSLLTDNIFDMVAGLIKVYQEGNPKKIKSELDKSEKRLSETKRINRESFEKTTGILYLGDRKLTDMMFEFLKKGDELFDESNKIMDAIYNKEMTNMDEMRALRGDIFELASLIKLKIDELALKE